MKFLLAALIVSQAVAFTFVNQPRMPTVLSAEPYVVTEGEVVINVRKFGEADAPKVVDMINQETGKKVYCRCWQSGTWPLCDASHVKHNEATGDNVGPLIITVPKKE